MPDVWTLFRFGPWRVRFGLVGVWLCGIGVVFSSVWCVTKIVLVLNDPRYAPKSSEPAKEVAAPFAYVLEFKDISFPILSRSQNRVMYGRFSLSLDCPSAAIKQSLERVKPRVVDAVLEVTAQFYEDDFRTQEGFTRLKQELMRALEKRLPGEAPRLISISDWTIG